MRCFFNITFNVFGCFDPVNIYSDYKNKYFGGYPINVPATTKTLVEISYPVILMLYTLSNVDSHVQNCALRALAIQVCVKNHVGCWLM